MLVAAVLLGVLLLLTVYSSPFLSTAAVDLLMQYYILAMIRGGFLLMCGVSCVCERRNQSRKSPIFSCDDL